MRQGEIWLVDFAPKIGAEIDKRRPALIVSHNAIGRLPLKIVVPFTDPPALKQSWHVSINPNATNGLSKTSVADCFQIKSLSQERFVKLLGVLSKDEIEQAKIVLSKVLDLL